MNKIFITLLLVIINILSINFAYSDPQQAIAYYQHGENSYHKKNYNQALDWYKKALELHKTDGQMAVDKNIIVYSKSYGRFAKKASKINITHESYYPNRRIREILAILQEQKRRADPPKLKLTWVTIREPTRDNVLDGGETGSIIINIENIGNTAALDVFLETTINDANGLTFNNQIVIGDIKAKQSTTASISITATRDIVEKNRNISIIAKEKSGFDSDVMDVLLHTKSHQSPNIVLSNIEIHDLSGDAKIEPTETVTITANVVNKGAGVSYPLIAHLKLGENVFLGPDNRKSIPLEKLYPGESRNVTFNFLTNRRFNHKQSIPASINVTNSKNTLVATKNLGVSIYSPLNKVSVNIKPLKRNFEYGNKSDLVDVDINIPTGKTKNKNAVAVVIGNKSYQIPGLPRVKYAINDARIMREYLINTLGFAENNIIYIEDATAARFNETFGNFNNFAGKLFNFVIPDISDVFIYYSGHGAPDLNSKNAYFVPVDVDPRHIATSGYSVDLLYKNLAKIPAKSFTIVLDTCFSGNSDGGTLLSGISPALIQTKIRTPSLNNAAIFTSTTRDQVSTWYHEKKHGLFTYFFLKGLSGYADNNKDTIITTTEIGEYLSKVVPYHARRINGNVQTPMLVQHKDIALARLLSAE